MKQSLQKRIENKGYQYLIHRDEKVTMIRLDKRGEKEKRETLELACKFRSLFYEIHIQGVKVKNIKSEIIKDLIDFFEKGKNKPFILRFELLSYEDKDYIKEILRKEYCLLNIKVDGLVESVNRYGDGVYIVECLVEKEMLPSLFEEVKWREKIEKTMALFEEKEILFKIFDITNNQFAIYMNGFKGEMRFIEEEKGWNLYLVNEKDKVIKKYTEINEKNIEERITDSLHFLKQQQRVKNLLQPPVYFYKQWIDLFYSDDIRKDKVYERLCTKMDALEVEYFTAHLLKNKNCKTKIAHGQFLQFHENKGIMLDIETCNVLIFEKNENWKKEVKTFLLQLKEIQIDGKLKEIH
jgi:hypothetical protein